MRNLMEFTNADHRKTKLINIIYKKTITLYLPNYTVFNAIEFVFSMRSDAVANKTQKQKMNQFKLQVMNWRK